MLLYVGYLHISSHFTKQLAFATDVLRRRFALVCDVLVLFCGRSL